MSDPSVVDGLASLPIIQAAVIIASTVAGVMLWLRGEKRTREQNGGLPPGASWFFDGPIVKALESLQGCYRILGEIRADNQRFAEEERRRQEEMTEILREILQHRRKS